MGIDRDATSASEPISRCNSVPCPMVGMVAVPTTRRRSVTALPVTGSRSLTVTSEPMWACRSGQRDGAQHDLIRSLEAASAEGGRLDGGAGAPHPSRAPVWPSIVAVEKVDAAERLDAAVGPEQAVRLDGGDVAGPEFTRELEVPVPPVQGRRRDAVC